MDDQRAHVADVGEMREQRERLDELAARRAPALEPEAEDRAAALGQQPLGERVVGMALEVGVADPFDRRVAVEMGDDLCRVLDVARHPHGQRLDALDDVERVGRAHAGAEVAQALDAGAHDEGQRAEFVGEVDAVIAGVGLGQGREQIAAVPVELAAVDQRAADRDAVAAEELGHRVIDDVGAQLDRPAEVRRREGVVDQQRQAVVVRDGGNARDVEHLEAGVAERLAEHEPRLGPDRRAEGARVARVDQRGGDAEARQRVDEQVVAAAVERARRDDMAARPHQRHHRERERRLARRRADRADAALERREPLFEHRRRRVRDARIDVARARQVEQRGRLVGVAEDVGRGLVDRHGARAGRRVGPVAGVDRARVETMELGLDHDVPPGARGLAARTLHSARQSVQPARA